jgi:shikimate kinase
VGEPERIVLVGFMGAGKTTVGEALARLLGWEFADMDRLVERRAGVTVAEVFRERGEPGFRAEERAVAEEVAKRTRCVVAAGGGAFAQPETREILRRGAVTVWLRCDLDTLLARVGGGGDVRPLAGSRETMRALLSERESSYRLADMAFETSEAAPEQVARRIADAVFPGRGSGLGGR